MKKIVWLTCVLCLFVFSTCFARIASTRINVGGVHPGTYMDEVVSLHGLPTGRNRNIYYYGESTSIIVRRDNTVLEIATMSRKFPTLDGVVSGMNESVLNDVYGTADQVEQKDGMTIYRYFGNHICMEFWVSSGSIHYIKVRG